MRKILGLLAALCLSALNLPADGVALAAALRSWPDLEVGEVLLNELACAGCHYADGAIRLRITAHQSPRLGKGGLALTPQYLRALLSDPQSQKPGSTMPDLLRELPDKKEAVEALTHYLISSQDPAKTEAVAANEFLLQQGRLLYHQVGCVACHAPQEPPARVTTQGGDESSPATIAPALAATSIPLGNLARKTTVAELARFLINPLSIRPAGRCPSLNLTKTEATSVAMYLLRDQAGLKDPNSPPAKVAGLQFQYYEGGFANVAGMENATVIETGVVPKFELSPRKRPEQVGLRFTGYIQIPKTGEYTFYSASDDGTKLYLDGRLVVDNDGHHGTEERSGKMNLEAGDHPAMLLWFNHGGPAELKVSYEGPGLKKQEIPASALTHLGQPMLPLDQTEFTLDPAKVKRGKDYFASMGCAWCHEVSGQKVTSELVVAPLSALAPKSTEGCLSSTPLPGVPWYDFSEAQRLALRKTFSHLDELAATLPATERAHRALATFNCYACHSRKGVGGPEPGRVPYFTTTFEVDMGDEGRLPPHLNEVGSKLTLPWFREVITNGASARPYMATRMPQFGAENVSRLAALFIKSDGSLSSGAPQRADAKHGRKLVGTTGLSCIACHTFADHASLGIPAMDLTLMPNRLQRTWFKQYLRDPAGLRPGTRMPSFWPEGQAVNKEILDGDTDRQIDSIWAYLSLAKDTGLPPGLIQGRMELVVTNEAVIYRHWISGAGPRTIAVGYPERANLAFDVDTLRLALIWQGPFIDAAKHRTGRGDGFGGPLGYNIVQFALGPDLALLSDPQAAWPAKAGAEAGYTMLGYRLAERQRPVLNYQIGNVQVEDHFVDVPGELDGTLKRTLTLKSDQPPATLWFRAWVGSDLVAKGQNDFLADGKVTLRVKPAPTVRRVQGRSELLVPIRFEAGTATVEEEILW